MQNIRYYKLNDVLVCFIGVQKIEVPVSNFVRKIEELSQPGVTIQAINARAIYCIDHLLGVLKITLECKKRNITVSTKPEIDLLLRLSLTNQIKSALNHAGLNALDPAIIIIYSTDHRKVAHVGNRFTKTIPCIDYTVLNNYKQNRDHVFRLLSTNERTRMSFLDEGFITQYLIERSALIIK